MLGIILGILYQISSSTHTIMMKNISGLINSRGATGTHLLFIPFGIAGIIISYFISSAPITDNIEKFYTLTILFGLIVLCNVYLGFSLLKDLNTSSFFKYKVGLTLSLGLLSDYLFFHIFPDFFSIGAGLLFFFSGNLLNNIEQKEIRLKLFFKLFILSFGIVTSTSLLKEIVLITTNDFLSIFVVQTITQLIIGLFGVKFFPQIIKDTKLFKYSIIYSLLIIILVIIEFYALQMLSVFMVLALSNIKFLIYLGFDYFTKELHFSKNTIIGIILGFLGILLLIIGSL